jgi:hypothetical protein
MPPSLGTLAPCAAALSGGTLVAHPDWGLAVVRANGRLTRVVFPNGYQAVRADDRIQLLDEHGNVVAIEGETVTMSGGFFGPGENAFEACGGVSRA